MKNMGLIVTKRKMDSYNIFEQIYFDTIDYIRLTEYHEMYVMNVCRGTEFTFNGEFFGKDKIFELFNKIINIKSNSFCPYMEIILYYTDEDKILNLTHAEVNEIEHEDLFINSDIKKIKKY